MDVIVETVQLCTSLRHVAGTNGQACGRGVGDGTDDQPKPGRLMGSERKPARNVPQRCCWRSSNSWVQNSAGKSQNQLCGHLRTDGILEARHKERIWNQSLMLKRRLTSTGELQKVEGRFAGKVVCSTELCSKILEFPTRSHTVMPV